MEPLTLDPLFFKAIKSCVCDEHILKKSPIIYMLFSQRSLPTDQQTRNTHTHTPTPRTSLWPAFQRFPGWRFGSRSWTKMPRDAGKPPFRWVVTFGGDWVSLKWTTFVSRCMYILCLEQFVISWCQNWHRCNIPQERVSESMEFVSWYDVFQWALKELSNTCLWFWQL